MGSDTEGAVSDFYLQVLTVIFIELGDVIGSNLALRSAEEAGVEIDDGSVVSYSGGGKDAVLRLVKEFGEEIGEKRAVRLSREAVKSNIKEGDYEKVPEPVQPSSSGSPLAYISGDAFEDSD
ncbi:MAG: hypothetical protein SVV03_02925 [Candidatus Nanohaloarchaea archaeon]|nr:hypothetical protein [Candidatus Nanohaloarchaea archaeon]